MRTENLANFKYTNSHFYFEKVEKEISKVLLVQQRSLFVGPKAAASLSLLFFWTNIEVMGGKDRFSYKFRYYFLCHSKYFKLLSLIYGLFEQ